MPKGGSFILRGPRYLISINPTYEVRQKLSILAEDFRDAAEMVLDGGPNIDEGSFFEQSAVLDYMKNAAVTLFNALVQPEKLGNFQLKSRAYQRVRDEMLATCVHAIRAYYAHLVGVEPEFIENVKKAREKLDSIYGATSHIEKQYVDGTFSSRYFTRPEAGHPLIIMASCCVTTKSLEKAPAVVVGLPSGGTELAIAQQYAFELIGKSRPSLMLLPISLHTIKNEFDRRQINERGFEQYVKRVAANVRKNPILLVEDNSSTGRTIQKAVELLERAASPSRVYVSVAEADIVRSTLDRHSNERVCIASAEAYDFSVAILPVSKVLIPKVDLRGLVERSRLAIAYERKAETAQAVNDKIMYKAFLRIIRHPYEEVRDTLSVENSITLFRKSFLSNFFSVPIYYRGTKYPSVEHAYQAQKFLPRTLQSIRLKDISEIKDILRKRGHRRESRDVEEMFLSRSMPAGNIKLVADYLRRSGYGRPDWDSIKIPLMINLLRQKFSNPMLRQELLRTSPKYLAEGNTWNDTLWGVCNGRGRNMLGQVLMILRDEYLKDMVTPPTNN